MAIALPVMEYNVRKRENGPGSGAASARSLPPVVRAGQPPPGEDFDPEVDAFLNRYPFLGLLLMESVDPLKAHFGETAMLSLTVEADPEVADWEYLVIAVRTTFPADQAQAQLEAFDADWWLEKLPYAQGKLLFTLEFV
jgi:hypothetical protein